MRRCGLRESRVLTAGGIDLESLSQAFEGGGWPGQVKFWKEPWGDNVKDGPGVNLTGVVQSVHLTQQLKPRGQPLNHVSEVWLQVQTDSA